MPHRRGLTWLLAVLFCHAQEPPPTPILSPPANSAHPAGPVRVIARGAPGAKLVLDGAPVAAKSPAPGVLTASITPKPGPHTLEIVGAKDGQKVRFFSGAGAREPFRPFRPHPPVETCTTCHAVKEGGWDFARPSLGGICFGCHDREAFPGTHSHVPGVLADCQLCHDPHGSTAKGHLKMSKETSCKQCHN